MHLHAPALGVLQLGRGLAGCLGDGIRQRLGHRIEEPRDLVVRERGREGIGRHLRRVQDLVGVGVADPRDRRLVAQHALDLGAAAIQQPGQRVAREGGIERVGSESCDAGHVGGVSHDVYRQRLLGSRLSEVEARAVRERDAQGDRRLARPDDRLRELVVPAEPPGLREVEHQMRPGGREVDELAVSRGAGDLGIRQRLDRRVVRLQRRDVGDRRPGDAHTGEPLAEEVDEPLHLGHLGHALILPRGGDTGVSPAVVSPARARACGSAVVGGEEAGDPAVVAAMRADERLSQCALVPEARECARRARSRCCPRRRATRCDRGPVPPARSPSRSQHGRPRPGGRARATTATPSSRARPSRVRRGGTARSCRPAPYPPASPS